MLDSEIRWKNNPYRENSSAVGIECNRRINEMKNIVMEEIHSGKRLNVENNKNETCSSYSGYRSRLE